MLILNPFYKNVPVERIITQYEQDMKASFRYTLMCAKGFFPLKRINYFETNYDIMLS